MRSRLPRPPRLSRAAAAGALATSVLCAGSLAPAVASAPVTSAPSVGVGSQTSAPADVNQLTTSRVVRGTVQVSGTRTTVAHTWSVQPTAYTCGPASLHIALGALGVRVSITQLSQDARTTRSAGTRLSEVARVMDARTPGVTYRATTVGAQPRQAERDRFTTEVSSSISAGYPVIVNIAATPGEQPAHYPNTYTMYHHFVAVGYDTATDQVLIADPAYFQRVRHFWVPADDLLEMAGGRGYISPVLNG